MEEQKLEEEKKAVEEAAAQAKSKAPAKGKGAKEELKEVVNTMEDQVENDPNAMKFVPDVIHFDRT